MTQAPAHRQQPIQRRVAPIGSATKEHRRVLLSLADVLRGLLDGGSLETIDGIGKSLEEAGTRIAITGRAGSGFARMANVIAGRPRLLPSTAPPKTVTVARITFDDANEPGSAARFQFFDTPDWQEILVAGGRLRPDLEDEERLALLDRVDREVEEMRTRAFMRLGDDFHKMMGAEHRIEELTAPVAARYLGAEVDQNDEHLPPRARFADITAEAQLYVHQTPFAESASVLVTPGFDDGFRVREERTAMILERCDLCIAVISADEPMTADTREMLELLTARMGERLMVLLDHDPSSRARVDRNVLRSVVAGFCSERLNGLEIPVVLCSSIEAERGLMAQSGALHEDPRPILDAANLTGIIRAIEEALFWGPGLEANEAAADALLDVAEREMEVLGRKIAIIRDRRERIRRGEQLTVDEVTRRTQAREGISEMTDAARAALEQRLSQLWGKARTDGLRLLREQAEAVAEGKLTGAGSDQTLRNARAPLSMVLERRLRDLLDEHRAEILLRLDEDRSALLAHLTNADVFESVPAVLQNAVALELDVSHALGPIRDASVHETSPDELKQRGDDRMRRLMVPYQTIVEKVTEDATLALGQAARSKLTQMSEAAHERLEQQSDAANPQAVLTTMVSRHMAIGTVIGKLGAYQSATARGRGPLAP
ncbi:MAG: hypothetical protein AAFU49_03820 [Pseudomonadota bacterium]